MTNQLTWTFAAELEDSVLHSKQQGSKQSGSPKSILSAVESSEPDGQRPQTSETLGTSANERSGKGLLMFLQEAFRANLSRKQAAGVVVAMKGSYGQNSLESCGNYDRLSHSLRTFQGCFRLSEEGPSTEYLVTWSRSGMIASGTVFQLQPLARLTFETEFGFWPTPLASDGRSGGAASKWRRDGCGERRGKVAATFNVTYKTS